jgi:ABC-type multidrug transport system ATPase subunit
MTLAVQATGLVKRFGATEAVGDISFDIEPGTLFGFIGPDGAGKSTLFRILVTLLVPDAGLATVLGLDVVRDLWALRRRIGYMPGKFSLYPDLSVAENLTFFASVFGTTVREARDRIAPIYSQLEPFSGRKAGALSGGMKQKLALCCALVHRPDILLLDEPTTGVDAVSRREFWDLLGEFRAEGLTIVVSTPYMDEAARCDRIALIQRGRLLGIDTPAAIAAGYGRPLYAVRAANRYAALQSLRRYQHTHAVVPFGDVLHFADRRGDASASTVMAGALAHLAADGVSGSHLEPTPPTVEDSFMALINAGGGGTP